MSKATKEVRARIKRELKETPRYELSDAERNYVVECLRYCQTYPGLLSEELDDDEIDALVERLVRP